MILSVVFYAFTFWLGVYLITRDLTSARLRWAGLGLVAYALAIAMDLLAELASGSVSEQLLQLHWALMLLPALFWSGAILGLIPLWRAVYRRYAVPASYSSRCLALPGQALAPVGWDMVESRSRAARVGKLEDSGPMWYNAGNAGRISYRGADNHPLVPCPEPVTTSRFGSPDYGPLLRVDYTGRAKILGGM